MTTSRILDLVCAKTWETLRDEIPKAPLEEINYVDLMVRSPLCFVSISDERANTQAHRIEIRRSTLLVRDKLLWKWCSC